MTAVSTASQGSGRGWAYTGAVLGGTVSIAANVAHSFVPPDGASSGWSPPAGAVVSAVCWPLLLLIGVEMLARIDWPPGAGWLLLRWAGLLPVAVIAAVVSYRHLSGLLAWYGEDPLTVVLGPLAVDGLMVMSAAALVAGRRRTGPRPPLADADRAGGSTNHPRPAHRATQVPAKGEGAGTETRTLRRTDDHLKTLLTQVRRESDGTVPVRRAAKALGTGPGRARRLLTEAGLLRGAASAGAPVKARGADKEPLR
ncbi:hypothetical protein K1W54_27320 [Micromonospora sp. CPCC 205371]|nr:hypothetical protein [Micromonospora sp. CPCC 205371]